MTGACASVRLIVLVLLMWAAVALWRNGREVA